MKYAGAMLGIVFDTLILAWSIWTAFVQNSVLAYGFFVIGLLLFGILNWLKFDPSQAGFVLNGGVWIVRIFTFFALLLFVYILSQGRPFDVAYAEFTVLGPNGAFAAIQLFALMFLPAQVFSNLAKLILSHKISSE